MSVPVAVEVRRMLFKRRQARMNRFFRRKSVSIGGFEVAVDRTRMPKDLTHLLYKGDYETAERAIVKRVVRPGDRVLEGGGGIGLVTMTLASIVGPERVVTYEASPAAFDFLSANLRANGLPVEVRRRALADAAGEITFHAHPNVLSSSTTRREGTAPVTVPADDIRAVIAEVGPTVLVLDIEGAEVPVLTAADLSGVRAIVMEVHPHVVGERALSDLYRHLLGAGFVLRHGLTLGKVMTFSREAAEDS